MIKPRSIFYNSISSKKTPTFGQARAEKLTQRMNSALTDRRKLARAEAAAADPLKTAYRHKSDLVERKIDRITAELLNAKK